MKDKYKVSIIVPVYNVEKYIEKCAISLLEQSFDDIQYVFIDDCGSDNSIYCLRKVIDNYPLRKKDILIISHEYNRGLSAARNTGVDNALGDYIYHVDSDDYIEKDTVKTLFERASSFDLDIVFANYINIYQENNKIFHNLGVNKDKKTLIKDIIFQNDEFHIWNVMIKRNLYIDNNIKALEGVNNGEDYLTLLLLVYASCNHDKIDAYLYNYIKYNVNSFQKNIDNEKNRIDLLKGNIYLQKYFENDSVILSYLKEYNYLLRVLYEINQLRNRQGVNGNLKHIWKFRNLNKKQILLCWIFNLKMYKTILFAKKIKDIWKYIWG